MIFHLTGAMNANPFASSVQQLLAAIQPSLFNLHEQQTNNHQRHHSLSTDSPSPNYMQPCGSDNTNTRVHTPKHSPIRKSHFEKSVSILWFFGQRKYILKIAYKYHSSVGPIIGNILIDSSIFWIKWFKLYDLSNNKSAKSASYDTSSIINSNRW